MMLNRQTDFALRLLILLGSSEGDCFMTITEASEALNIARNHLTKIVSRLNQLGYIETVRGAKGGFRLNKPCSEINVGQVVCDFESTTEIVNCKVPKCPFRNQCKLKTFMNEAMVLFLDKLRTHFLSDIVN